MLIIMKITHFIPNKTEYKNVHCFYYNMAHHVTIKMQN